MSEVTNNGKLNKKLLTLQAVRAVATLVLICLVCGLLLALCNDLLYVSPEEKFNRKLAKIYPGTFTVDNSYNELNSEFAKEDNNGEILKVYKSTDGDYILQSRGKGGYSNGSVTLYVAVSAKTETIVGWAIESNSGQSFIGNITEKHQKQWYVGTRVDGDLSLTDNTKVGGTTMSSTAINNAIKKAAAYCMGALSMGYDAKTEAKKAIKAMLVETNEGYAEYELADYSDIFGGSYGGKTVKQMLSDDNNVIDYYFRATGALGEIQAFVYGKKEDRKFVVIDSNYEIVYKTENVEGTEEFVTNITATNKVFADMMPSGAARYAYLISKQQNGDETTYTVVGLKVGTTPNNYILVIKIKEAEAGGYGEIISAALSTEPNGDGYVPGPPPDAPTREEANNLINSLVGANLANFNSKYEGGKVTHGTQSADLIAIAAKAALTDFDASLKKA